MTVVELQKPRRNATAGRDRKHLKRRCNTGQQIKLSYKTSGKMRKISCEYSGGETNGRPHQRTSSCTAQFVRILSCKEKQYQSPCAINALWRPTCGNKTPLEIPGIQLDRLLGRTSQRRFAHVISSLYCKQVSGVVSIIRCCYCMI